jgi:hypothetical protein
MADSNGIAHRQMQEPNLQRLAAQRQLYSNAKIIVGLQLVLSIFVIFFISMSSLLLGSQWLMGYVGHRPLDISWIVTTSGVLIVIVDLLVLSPLSDRFRERAAKIQELFDCEVLQISWNSITAGDRPSLEEVHRNAQKYRTKHQVLADLEHWYCADADTVPLSVGRIICQRSNISWDVELRKKIMVRILIVASVLFLVLLVFGLAGDLSLKTFLTKVIAPFLPMFVFSVQQCRSNQQTIERLNGLLANADAAFQNAKNPSTSSTVLDDTARRLQDNIFNHRKSSPLIFDWLYDRYRASDESIMNVSCQELVSQYTK